MPVDEVVELFDRVESVLLGDDLELLFVSDSVDFDDQHLDLSLRNRKSISFHLTCRETFSMVVLSRYPDAIPVGLVEIAVLMGVKRNTVDQWRYRDETFPKSRWTVGGRPAWDWRVDIEPWAIKSDRIAHGISLHEIEGILEWVVEEEHRYEAWTRSVNHRLETKILDKEDRNYVSNVRLLKSTGYAFAQSLVEVSIDDLDTLPIDSPAFRGAIANTNPIGIERSKPEDKEGV